MSEHIKRLTDDPRLNEVLEEILNGHRRVALVTLLDVVGDMNADGLDLLRRIGSPDYKSLTKLFREGNSETFDFLAQLRPAEVKDLAGGIELVRAFRTTGSFVKWAIISLAVTLSAVMGIVTWYRGGK